MLKKTGLTFILFFLVFVTYPVNGQESFLLKKDITVAAGEVQKNVITFGGTIIIEGVVNENVMAFGGKIVVAGEVQELVLGIGADIVLKSTAEIDGDVVSLGGSLTKEPGTQIDGDTIYFESSEDFKTLLREGLLGRVGISLIPFLIIVKLIMAFIWFILAIVLVAVFPRQIAYASNQIKTSFGKIFAAGILGLIVYVALIIFAALLSLALIGIPILIALIIIGIVIKVFGQVILFYFFGETLLHAFSKKQHSPLLIIITGFFLVTLVGIVPLIGPLLSLVLSLIGWGVVVRTKFGTTENWFVRRAHRTE